MTLAESGEEVDVDDVWAELIPDNGRGRPRPIVPYPFVGEVDVGLARGRVVAGESLSMVDRRGVPIGPEDKRWSSLRRLGVGCTMGDVNVGAVIETCMSRDISPSRQLSESSLLSPPISQSSSVSSTSGRTAKAPWKLPRLGMRSIPNPKLSSLNPEDHLSKLIGTASSAGQAGKGLDSIAAVAEFTWEERLKEFGRPKENEEEEEDPDDPPQALDNGRLDDPIDDVSSSKSGREISAVRS